MQNRKITFTPKNVLFYLSGFLVTALGVIFMLRGDLGAGAWDTVTANLNSYILSLDGNLSLGVTSMLVTSVLFVIVLIYTKKWQLIGMLIPIILMGSVIDFWDILVFGNYYPDVILLQLLFSFLGMMLIPLGLALILSSKFPATVFDEFTLVVMHFFKTEKIVRIRLGIEFLGISLGILFGFLSGIGFGAVNFGSIVVALVLPSLLNFYISKIGAFKDERN